MADGGCNCQLKSRTFNKILVMAKEQHAQKSEKKKAEKNLKEKRAEKKAKKATKKNRE